MNAAARCPSDLALEGYLLQPERSPVTPHVETCEHCRARVARMEDEGEEFKQYVFPATVEAVQEAAGPVRRFDWTKLFAPIATLAAVGAAAMLVVRTGPVAPAGPSSDYVGTKGAVKVSRGEGRAGLKVYMGSADGATQLDDGATIPANAALRFKVKPDEPHCWLWIVSVDGKGQISRIFPPQGSAAQDVAAGPVPGGAVLDGQPGLERLFAVCADAQKTTWEDVRRAASPAAQGEDALRRTRVLGEPLDDECQSTLLLEKR